MSMFWGKFKLNIIKKLCYCNMRYNNINLGMGCVLRRMLSPRALQRHA